jgi:hypothetical protein
VESSVGHSVKHAKAESKVQTFGHELPRPLDLDSHSVKPPKAKPKVQTKKEHPTLFRAPNNSFNLMAKILSMINSLLKKNRRPLDHCLGFHSRPTQTSFKSPSPSFKSNHFELRWPLDFGCSVKGRGRTLGFLRFNWWKSIASQPSAIV